MYSVEERQKAVDLYLKYGRNAALTIRELGYPNRHALIQWVREYEKTGELHEKPAGHRGYSNGSENMKRQANCMRSLLVIEGTAKKKNGKLLTSTLNMANRSNIR